MVKSLSQRMDSDMVQVLKTARKTMIMRSKNTSSINSNSNILTEKSPSELLAILAKMPFYCGDDSLHTKLPDGAYHTQLCCLTHTVGLPIHPATQKEMPLTSFQIEFVNTVITEVTNPEGSGISAEEWLRKAHKFHVLKGRQMGFTEITLRLIQFFCFTRYAGQSVGVMAATNGELANRDLRRFADLFRNIPQVVSAGGIKNRKLNLVNGTSIEAYSASEEAMTGHTNYACIFMDESGKWTLVDDTPVFNSILPIVDSNGADLFLVSTPKGPVKMFYKIFKDPQDFIMLQYDIWRTEGNMYHTDQINQMLETSKADPNQEYLCKFTIGENSILGTVTEDDRGDFSEWDADGDGTGGINEAAAEGNHDEII